MDDNLDYSQTHYDYSKRWNRSNSCKIIKNGYLVLLRRNWLETTKRVRDKQARASDAEKQNFDFQIMKN